MSMYTRSRMPFGFYYAIANVGLDVRRCWNLFRLPPRPLHPGQGAPARRCHVRDVCSRSPLHEPSLAQQPAASRQHLHAPCAQRPDRRCLRRRPACAPVHSQSWQRQAGGPLSGIICLTSKRVGSSKAAAAPAPCWLGRTGHDKCKSERQEPLSAEPAKRISFVFLCHCGQSLQHWPASNSCSQS